MMKPQNYQPWQITRYSDFIDPSEHCELEREQILQIMENDLEKEKHYFNPAYYLDLKWQLQNAR